MSEYLTSQDVAVAEIMEHFLSLHRKRFELRRAGIEPTGVIIPARLNVPYDSPTNFAARCMGLPVIWSTEEHWGIVAGTP